MHRLARWCILFSTYYSIIAGIMPYAFDIDTRLATKKTSITIYCIIVNIISVIVTFFVYNEELFNAVRNETIQIHEIIFVINTLIRILSAIATLALNWYYRNEVIKIVCGFAALRRKYFDKLQVSSSNKARI